MPPASDAARSIKAAAAGTGSVTLQVLVIKVLPTASTGQPLIVGCADRADVVMRLFMHLQPTGNKPKTNTKLPPGAQSTFPGFHQC